MKIFECEPFPNPRRLRVFLAEKGVEIPRVQVNLPEREHLEPEFLSRNPAGTVPLLELDDGTYLSETVAISRYIEALYPEPPLMGGTPQQQAEVEMWQRRVEQALMDPLGAYFHHATEGLGDVGRYRNKAWGEHSLERARGFLKTLDQQLATNPYVAGEQYSIADITAFCGVDVAAAFGVPVPDEYQSLHRWYQAVSSRPSAAA